MPVGGVYVPHTSRSASQTSPTVDRAARAARIGTSTLSVPCAAARKSSRARLAASPSRSARNRASRAAWASSMAGSTRSGSYGSSSLVTKRLTPTTVRSAASICLATS